MSFGAPAWLWALLVIPALVALYVRAERQSAVRLQQFAAAKLLPQLAGAVNRFRRALRFALLFSSLALAILALAQPRWGYIYEEAKRKGLDVLIAVDTSRSMLSNDVPPSRLGRVKLATQDFVNELQGDRLGLIAFAGRAFVQAPLTIDYSAVIDSINDLDTNTIPEGGTNISEAINLAAATFGKSATGNRALIIFTDGEELSGDAVKTAKDAADAGVRIFTVGVGTPEGSLIPLAASDGNTEFVKDSKGQVVKSKLDEKRLREIAQATGGIYLHLENGPATMRQLVRQGLAQMQSGDIDARMSRRPIERYQWPLGLACISLASWFLVAERKRVRARARVVRPAQVAVPAAAMLMLFASSAFASAPGIDAYRSGQFSEALQQFEQTLQQHPPTEATDKLSFDRGTAAYKLKDYNKALESFSQALLSPDAGLQGRSHYNLGNTLYERGEAQKSDEKKLTDWTDALHHYEETLKIAPQDKEAKDNYEFVKNEIEKLKRKQEQSPTPTPPPQNQKQQNKQDKQQQNQQQQNQDTGKQQDQQKQDQQKQDQQQQQQQGQQQQQQQNSGKSDQQKEEQKQQQQSGSDKQQRDQQPKSSPDSSPSPSPGEENGAGESPSPSPGESPPQPEQQNEQQNGSGESPAPSATAGSSPPAGESEGSGEGASPSPGPSASAGKKLTGDVKGASDEKPNEQQQQQIAEAEVQPDGKMSEKQAEMLLRSMKDEEQRVQLDERRRARHVYNDW